MTTTPHPFDQALVLESTAPGHFRGHTNPAYWNMVGPFGGITAATVLRAILLHPDRLGDPLPRMQGRVTLNPLAHIDPLGTVLFPALMALGVGIPLAWGKPVQISESPRHLTRRFSLRTIRLMISVAGPAMNLALALLLSLVFLLVAQLGGGAFVYDHILQLVALNFGLLFFNMLPIPPLDGRSLLAFLPDSLAVVRDALTRYGGFIFLALICIGGFGQGPGPLQYLMLPFTLFTRIYLGWLLQLGGLA